MRKLREFFPLEFRILYRQFLPRVIDLELLSVHADVPRFLGQFASVLVFISLIGAVGLLFVADNLTPNTYLPFVLGKEQSLISNTMLLVGLIAVVGWDSAFPDRQDVLVLSPLPIPPRTILSAKIAASASILGIAVFTLNFATGVAWPIFLGSHHQSHWGILTAFGAYWLTMLAASLFLYCSVLAIQGFTSLLLPRRVFLILSALLQVAAFGLFLAVYFLEPTISSFTMAGSVSGWLRSLPSLWFFGLFNQLNGSLPPELGWAAERAWIGVGLSIAGAIVSLLLCYRRTMRKMLEELDLVPGRHHFDWAPRLSSPLRTAVVLFTFRSILRSRQRRLAVAAYAAVAFLMALPWVHIELSSPTPLPLTADFLTATFIIVSLTVLCLRGIFSLPISLTANWVLRTTQLCPTEKYVAATRLTLLLLGVAPAWLIAALLSIRLRPWHEVAIHLLILALVGWLLAEVALINFYKIPFTCSYLPGKVHIQVMFWCAMFLLAAFAITSAEVELPALGSHVRSSLVLVTLAACGLALWMFNNHRAKSAQLYFEELPPQVITSLGIGPLPPHTQSATSLR